MSNRIAWGSTLLTAVLASSSAFAQTGARAGVESAAPADAAAVTSEVVVTAQRREQRLKDVPISAVVTTGRQLERANLLDLTSVAVRTPAVHISTSPSSDFVVIRGVGSSLNNGFEQSVSTFVDGLYRGRSRSTRAALFDVERVEILKGPQTTFFGSNAIAGAFNITTRKPGRDLEANASAFYGPATDEYNLEAGLGAPLSDSLSVRIAGRASGGGSYLENESRRIAEPDFDQRVGRISLRWQPSSSLETNLRLDVGRQRDKGVNAVQLLHCPADPAIFGAPRGLCGRYLAASGGRVDDTLNGRTASNPSAFNFDFLEAEHSTSIELGWATLIATTGYFEQDYALITDSVPVPPRLGGSVTSANAVGPSNFMEDFEQFSQELRLQSPSGARLEYMVGAYYSDSLLRLDQYQGLYFTGLGALAPAFYTAATPIAFHITNRESAETVSAFGSATYHVSSDIRLNLGLRYSVVKKRASRFVELGVGGDLPSKTSFLAGPEAAQAILIPGAGLDRPNYADTDRTDKRLMPTVSVQYDLTPDVMAYASYTRGFKAGGFSAYSSNSTFGPETVDAYELGFKSRFLERRASLDVALFWSDYADLQESTTVIISTGAVRQQVGNVAGSRARGVEIGASLRPVEGLVLSADLAYLDAKYTDYPNAPCTARQALSRTPCVQDMSGRRRAFAPEFSGNVTGAYERMITDSLRLRLDTSVYFTSRYYLQPVGDPLLSQSAFAKVDMRIGIGSGDRRWEVAVVGKNLSNCRTRSFMQNTPTSPGTFQVLEDPSRSIAAQLSIRF